ncbi:MAG: hypothetical protein DRI28_05765 [Caldiserica bacterium]|nr:MAG: hypothetical protein DRI28_05765 [Caldisericota bacterium]
MSKIKFSGHTMGTPQCNIYEAMKVIKDIGYDGIEVRVAPDGQINSEKISNSESKDIYKSARKIGIEFSCLSSYYKDFINKEARTHTILNLKRVVEIADILKCPNIRVYGGIDPSPPGVWFVENWEKTVSGIREVAKYAATFGIKVCIETHIGSLTMSVRDTIRLIDDIGMNNVGMLFDYAWVELAGIEKGKEAVRKASKYIYHCHIKDWKIFSKKPLQKKACLMGEGDIQWKEVIKELKNIGYIGYISDEYEKFWSPHELPDAKEGMKHNLKWVKNILRE